MIFPHLITPSRVCIISYMRNAKQVVLDIKLETHDGHSTHKHIWRNNTRPKHHCGCPLFMNDTMYMQQKRVHNMKHDYLSTSIKGPSDKATHAYEIIVSKMSINLHLRLPFT